MIRTLAETIESACQNYRSNTYVDCVKLLSSQRLAASDASETVDMINVAHGRATVSVADNFLIALAANSKEIAVL